MAETGPSFAPTQEVRFALVMYGGSSLCIYMNGVAQEFLNMVRATAPCTAMSTAPTTVGPLNEESTEPVYRKVGQLLRYDAEPLTGEPAETDPVTTRFVVDIISGSSAGGINGVFLAKALTNEQKIEKLKQLWIKEGDFALLLNDGGQAAGTPGLPPSPPTSLLSGHRMYRKLLDAFTAMDRGPEPPEESRLVEELDLAVTTTDLRGLRLPIKLSDSVVWERRYRNVFELKYRTPAASGRSQNDFRNSNPGLAFVARCTSSFPFVFEPSVLKDINGVLDSASYDSRVYGSSAPGWGDVFFPDYQRMHDDYANRSFGDGGDIDNKPFSYAIDNLAVRRSTVPVRRKLVYVEPDPGRSAMAGPDPTSTDVLNTFESVRKAVSLPRAETIREDLARVRDHNLAAAQVQDVVDTIERALLGHVPSYGTSPLVGTGPKPVPAKRAAGPAAERRAAVNETGTSPSASPAVATSAYTKAATEAWIAEPPEEARAKGMSYVVYHRLKVHEATESLGLLVARAADLDDDSDRSQAVRLLVHEWVAGHYADPFGTGDDASGEGAPKGRPSENLFLLDFDADHRTRRINFVLRRADELLCGNERSQKLLKLAVGATAPPADLTAFEDSLKCAKMALNKVFVDLRNLRRAQQDGIKDEVQGLGISDAQLDAILVAGAVEQILHTLRLDGNPEPVVDFEGTPPVEGENPRTIGRVELTVLGPRQEAEEDSLHVRPGDPTRTYAAGVGSGGEAAGDGTPPGLDAGATLVVRLTEPATRVTLKVSSLFWPPKTTASAENAPAITKTLDRGRTGTIEVVGTGVTKVVVASPYPVGDAGTAPQRAQRILADPTLQTGLAAVACTLRTLSVAAFTKASDDVDKALGGGDKPLKTDIACRALRFFFDHFDDYDMPILPLLLGQGAPPKPVDVLRISPYDATSLVPAANAAEKLAGNKLGHFAAFAHEPWRRSDIMWGRLDAAERLITALLPADHPQRADLLRDAQERILREELVGNRMAEALSDAVLAGDPPIVDAQTRQVIRDAAEKAVSAGGLRDYIQQHYKPEGEPSTEYVLKLASRGTRIVGDILKHLPESEPGAKRGRALGRVLARLGLFGWGLVEMSVPGTIANRLTGFWLQRLAFTEVFLLVAGILLNNHGAVRLGWLTLAITLALVVARALLAARLSRAPKPSAKPGFRARVKRWFRSTVIVVGIAVGATLLGLALFGGYTAAANAHDRVCRSAPKSLARRAFPFSCPAKPGAAALSSGGSAPR